MEQERRTSGGQRVPFEALVVVANQKGGAGAYECEAVDLSETGMHLRTAYLPEQGQRLTFRFDTGTGEVTLEGEVVWCTEEARGGEFGVRFARIDDATLAAIRETLGLPADGGAPVPEKVGRGARVRLHIDGLNSPMRARVRDDHTGEILVGSNLDFLKVGKPLELEDVERGKRRGALVDKVEVEVDPASKVPQLVVTLRYEDAGQAADSAKAAAGVKATTDTRKSSVQAAASDAPKGEEQAEAAEPEAPAPSPLKETLAQAGARITVMSAAAREAVGKLIERIRERRSQESEEGEETKAPVRRVTAPPPDGGIQTSTRRQQRSSIKEESVDHQEQNSEDLNGLEENDEETLKIRKKQRIMIAVGASLLAVLLVVFGLRAKSSAPPAELAAASAEPAAVPGLPVNALPVAPGAPGAGSADVVTANVPLFGATPLSTTEPAPLPAPAVSAAAAAPGDAEGSDDKGDPGQMEFGQGDVKKPRTVRIKMDAPITGIRGSTTDDVITLFLPGRRNIEPASPLSKRDKRLSAVKAVSKDGGVELTLSFKDSVPPFLAKANGKILEIDLGQPAKDGSDDGEEASVKKSSKKKIAKGSKAADKKKASAKKAKKARKAKKSNDDLASAPLGPPRAPPHRGASCFHHQRSFPSACNHQNSPAITIPLRSSPAATRAGSSRSGSTTSSRSSPGSNSVSWSLLHPRASTVKHRLSWYAAFGATCPTSARDAAS
jgi:hypothetical protein